MLYSDEDEMTDTEIRVRYGMLIDQAVEAFAIDANYSADIVKKGQLAQARRDKRTK